MKKTAYAVAAAAALFASLFCSPLQAKVKAPEVITVMSYNIRYGDAKDGTNSWEYRYPASAMMIDDQKPDIIGLQEALDYQQSYLGQYCNGYAAIGVGRENGRKKGEHMSILYNKSRIKLIKWGTFWLSETPDKPSKGWDAACMRTATWAIMKDKNSKQKFLYVNTHLDHKGKLAQANGLALIMEKIKELNPKGYPVIVTGDFNITLNDPAMAPIKAEMKDARSTAFVTDNLDSFNGWGKESSKIDYVWYKGFSSCSSYETVTKSYYDRTYISDHYPVKAVLVF